MARIEMRLVIEIDDPKALEEPGVETMEDVVKHLNEQAAKDIEAEAFADGAKLISAEAKLLPDAEPVG